MLLRCVLFTICHCIVIFAAKYAGRVFRKIHRIEEVTPNKTARGAIIFLHGVGDTGPGFKKWFDTLLGNETLFKGMHLIFPTAPLVPINKERTQFVNGWYEQRYYKYYRAREDLAFTYPIFEDFIDIINNETKTIPPRRIFIGGFGMGGNVAMQFVYKYNTELGGVFSLSGFLKRHSITFRMIKQDRKINRNCRLPDVFMVMGEDDPEVDPEWVVKTFKRLRRLGVQGKLNTMLHAHHEITKNELKFLNNWIKEKMSA